MSKMYGLTEREKERRIRSMGKGGYIFFKEEDAIEYSRQVPYNFYEESQRLLREFRTPIESQKKQLL